MVRGGEKKHGKEREIRGERNMKKKESEKEIKERGEYYGWGKKLLNEGKENIGGR